MILQDCGQIGTTIHTISPRFTPTSSSGSVSDADDEREEVDITMYTSESLLECKNPPGKTPKRKKVESEIPERATDLEQNGGEVAGYTRIEPLEPEEPASDCKDSDDETGIL